MKTIKVRAYSAFSHYLADDKKNKWLSIEIPDDATVEMIVNSLGIPYIDLGLTIINGKFFSGGLLNDGDVLEIYPVVSGG